VNWLQKSAVRFLGIEKAFIGKDGFGWPLSPLPDPSMVQVTEDQAFKVGIVFSCVSRISADLAQLPIRLINEQGGQFTDIRNSVTSLLNVTPDNGNCNSFVFRESAIAMMLLYGKHYIRVHRQQRTAKAVMLEHIAKDRVKAGTYDGIKAYKINYGDGKHEVVLSDDMIELSYTLGRGPGQNLDTISLMKAAQDYATKFFSSGGGMNGIISTEQPLTPEQQTTLLESWSKQSGKQTRLLPFAMRYNRLSVEPDKAQNTASREYQATEVCRLFNIPPQIIGINTSSAYKSQEEASIFYAKHTLTPLAARIECELKLRLLFGFQRENFYFRHDMDELMRGDAKSRAEANAINLQNGILNRNEVRARERLNPIVNGNIYTVQSNQIDLEQMDEFSKKIASNGTSTDTTS
jgi:HK97 family phage portal protein